MKRGLFLRSALLVAMLSACSSNQPSSTMQANDGTEGITLLGKDGKKIVFDSAILKERADGGISLVLVDTHSKSVNYAFVNMKAGLKDIAVVEKEASFDIAEIARREVDSVGYSYVNSAEIPNKVEERETGKFVEGQIKFFGLGRLLSLKDKDLPMAEILKRARVNFEITAKSNKNDESIVDMNGKGVATIGLSQSYNAFAGAERLNFDFVQIETQKEKSSGKQSTSLVMAGDFKSEKTKESEGEVGAKEVLMVSLNKFPRFNETYTAKDLILNAFGNALASALGNAFVKTIENLTGAESKDKPLDFSDASTGPFETTECNALLRCKMLDKNLRPANAKETDLTYFVETGAVSFPVLPKKENDLIVSDISLTMLGADEKTGSLKRIPITVRVFDIWSGVKEVEAKDSK